MGSFTANWAQAPPSQAEPLQPGALWAGWLPLRGHMEAGSGAKTQCMQDPFPSSYRARHLAQKVCRTKGDLKESLWPHIRSRRLQNRKPECFFWPFKSITETTSSSFPAWCHCQPTCAWAQGLRATLSLLAWICGSYEQTLCVAGSWWRAALHGWQRRSASSP